MGDELRDYDSVVLVAGDALQVAFCPVVRWRDSLRHVFGLAMPGHAFCRIAVDRIVIQDGHPQVLLNVKMLDKSTLVNISEDQPQRVSDCGQTFAPEGWWCSRMLGHDGPCISMPVEEAVATRRAPLTVLGQYSSGVDPHPEHLTS